MDCLRKAGRQRSYRDSVIYTTLSPCMMCTGTIILFKIPTVVIGECVNFGGNEQLLRDRGVNVIDLNDQRCIDLMARFIRERPDIWNEDIAEVASGSFSVFDCTAAISTTSSGNRKSDSAR